MNKKSKIGVSPANTRIQKFHSLLGKQYSLDGVACLEKLMEGAKTDLINNQVQAFMYRKEVMNPVHLGKEDAQQKMDLYLRRITQLKEIIYAYQEYAKVTYNYDLE